MLSVVSDMPLDNEASVVTLLISRLAGSTRFFGCTHRGRVCVRAFIDVSVRSCI